MFESQCKIRICLHQWLCLPLETCLSCAEHIVEPAAEAAAQPVHQPARAQAEIPQDLAAVGAGPLPGAAGPAAGKNSKLVILTMYINCSQACPRMGQYICERYMYMNRCDADLQSSPWLHANTGL